MGERKLHPTPEQGTKAESFFNNQIDVLPVSKEEFLQIVKSKCPLQSEEDTLQTKGINFEQDGRIFVLLRTDIFPEQYMPYLEIHEKWEAYIARKSGYNLFKKATREYQRDKETDLTQEADFADFRRDIGVYNYDFRHEVAVYKEYQQAMLDGKLEEYHQWMMNLREQEKPNATGDRVKLIENDTEIRKSIYNKLVSGSEHRFVRK